MEFKVTFVRYDESGNPFDLRVEGRFHCRDNTVTHVTNGLDDLVQPGDSLREVHRKLHPPHFRIEQVA